jgi:16S rRNA processing protein RimM
MGDEGRAQLLAVGRVQTSHGLKGYLKVKSLSGEIEHLLRLKSIRLGGAGKLTLFEVEDVRPGVGTVLLKLAGIDNRETGDEYRGQFVWVDRQFASVLGEEEYYISDLLGCRLFQGKILESTEGKRLIVPFSKHFVGAVDIADRRIELTEAYEQP